MCETYCSMRKLAEAEQSVAPCTKTSGWCLSQTPRSPDGYGKKGIKKIDFHIGQYIHVAQDMVRPTILRELGAALGTIFGRDIPIEQLAEAANLNAKLVLAIDGRRVAGLQPEDFGPVVQRIVDDDDEGSVDLVTKHDHIIRRGDLVLRQTVEVERFLNTNTVNHGDAWDQMRDYMRKLSQDGALDQ